MPDPASANSALTDLVYLALKYRGIPPALLVVGMAAALYAFRRRIAIIQPAAVVAATVTAGLVIAAEAADCLSYLTLGGYYDHVEPSIAAVAWWYSHGHPLYPDWDAGQGIYGWQYGPLLFQIEAAALAFSPTVLASKLPGIACFWLSAGLVFSAFRPLVASTREALWPPALLMMTSGSFFLTAIWIRSDPELMLFASLGLLSWRRLRPVAAASVLGFAAGCLINLKIHAVMYVVPYGVALLVAAPRPRVALAGVVVAVLTAALPFALDSQVTLCGYGSFLGLALHHGLDRTLLMQNLRLTCLLILPVPWLIWRQRKGNDAVLAAAYAVSVAVVMVIGSKKGAGPAHMLPFMPLFAYLLLRAVQAMPLPEAPRARSAARACIFLAAMVGTLPGFLAHAYDAHTWLARTSKPEYRAEAEQLQRDYPDAVMGAADDGAYPLTQYKLLPVLAGASMVFDTSTWMDIDGAGLPDDALMRLVTDCRVRHWIIPGIGTAFTQHQAYGPGLLFSDRFRARFISNYEVIRTGTYYKVWGCKALSEIPAGSRSSAPPDQ